VSRYVALLRGVNVGGKGKLPMAELRGLLGSLGYTDVETFIQSGNAVFTSSASVAATRLESAIRERFSIDVAVMLRSAAQLRKVVDANPYSGVDPSKLHVGFMARKPAAALLAKLETERFLPEEFTGRGTELYLYLPSGMGRAKLPAFLDRQIGIPTTVRNWNTVTKLAELANA
jgi:uncharacterized protein (DUF1697 family)